jgi:hypothetical protein
MNSLKVDEQSLQQMLFSNSLGYLDQDMFILVIICGLFETESLSQVDAQDSRAIKIHFNQLVDDNENDDSVTLKQIV